MQYGEIIAAEQKEQVGLSRLHGYWQKNVCKFAQSHAMSEGGQLLQSMVETAGPKGMVKMVVNQPTMSLRQLDQPTRPFLLDLFASPEPMFRPFQSSHYGATQQFSAHVVVTRWRTIFTILPRPPPPPYNEWYAKKDLIFQLNSF